MRSSAENAAPAVSIIIPAYNLAHCVAETVEAALSQQGVDVEIIAVNDGSTDDTLAQLGRYADRGLRVLDQPNRGAAAARNAGFAASHGRAILFLDGDDLIAPDHVAALLGALAGSDRHLAFGQWDRFRESPSEASFPPRPGYGDAAPVDWIVTDWAEGRPMTQCGTFLIPRALIAHHGGWDESLSLTDDLEFFTRMMVASDGLRFAPAARVWYCSTGSGLASRRGPAAVESAFRSVAGAVTSLLACEDSMRTRRAAATLLTAFDYTYFPDFADLRRSARARAAALGGSTLQPDGSPRFHTLRRFIGWRMAKRVERCVRRFRRMVGEHE